MNPVRNEKHEHSGANETRVSNGMNWASYKPYVFGYVYSVLLTVEAYLLVTNEVFSGFTLIAVLLCLAFVQLVVQLVFFLHLGSESKPRWNLVAFLFMALVLLIVVIGSLWIMENLNYNMMPSMETDTYIKNNQDSLDSGF